MSKKDKIQKVSEVSESESRKINSPVIGISKFGVDVYKKGMHPRTLRAKRESAQLDKV